VSLLPSHALYMVCGCNTPVPLLAVDTLSVSFVGYCSITAERPDVAAFLPWVVSNERVGVCCLLCLGGSGM